VAGHRTSIILADPTQLGGTFIKRTGAGPSCTHFERPKRCGGLCRHPTHPHPWLSPLEEFQSFFKTHHSGCARHFRRKALAYGVGNYRSGRRVAVGAKLVFPAELSSAAPRAHECPRIQRSHNSIVGHYCRRTGRCRNRRGSREKMNVS